MTYSRIRPCAFMPGSGTPLNAEFSALVFPAHWRAILLDLYRHGRGNPDKIRSVPIRRLRQLLHAVAPELIALSRDASPDDADPVLFCARSFPPAVTRALVAAWAADLPRGDDAAGPVRDALIQLGAGDLQWIQVTMDLLEQSVTAGGTAEPAERLYALLPEFLARRIAGQEPYMFEGVQLRFVQASPSQRGAAELVSWPPRTFAQRNSTRVWHFSFYLRISLQTVPFDPRPRIHLHAGVRRWESDRKVYIPPGDSVSVYLAARAPWIEGAPTPDEFRFGKGRLVWRPREKACWAMGGPEEMLRRLTFATEFPDPQDLVNDPAPWLEGPGGITAAVVYSTAMGKTHGVGPGMMPRDRSPLMEWAAQALQPALVAVPDLVRSAMPVKPSNAPARKLAARASTDDTAARERDAAASARRAQLARVLGERNFIVDVFCQTTTIREAIIEAAVEDLGLAGAEVPADLATRTWATGELDVQLRPHDLGDLGSGLLLDGEVPATRDQRDAAVAERRLAVSRDMRVLLPGSSLVLAEIDRPARFAGPLADPKVAMRLGFADANLVSQFLHPPDDDDDPDETIPHRALAAWQDGLRQVGLASLPTHSLGDRVPADLQHLAIWIVRKNRSGPTGHAHFLPVAVLMRPESPGALGIVPRLTQWVPYGELLQAIGQNGTIEETWSREAAQSLTERFIRQVLYATRNRPTLLLTHAQNLRSWWPALTNSAVIRDHVGFGGTMSKAALYGQGLRHIRVRDSDSFETPQWFAPNENSGRPGLAEGLWLPAEAGPGNRVFGSTTGKPVTASHAAVSASKLVPRSAERPKIDTGQHAWNPSLLEIVVLDCGAEDDPEAFAALAHQLRVSPDHRDALKLPVPLHLASRAAEYVLHTEEPEA
jgi:pPIWI_RE module N-terminal domain/RNaseH domain of pPIWI_RE/MID domain of pPIWI_RE